MCVTAASGYAVRGGKKLNKKMIDVIEKGSKNITTRTVGISVMEFSDLLLIVFMFLALGTTIRYET